MILSKTRDAKQFGMVFNENRNYGYERNLFGSKKLGILVSLTTLLGAGVAVLILTVGEHHKVRPEWIIGLVVLVGLTALWLVLPSKARTKTTAFKYAEQLLDAAVQLDGAQSTAGSEEGPAAS